MGRRILRLLLALASVAIVTWAGARFIPVNTTTQGFAYLLLVLVIASNWGLPEAAAASITATLAFNFYFFEPTGTLTISDPRNWVALFSFLVTSLIASQLSTKAKRRAFDAVARQQDLERLYSFSRAILLIDDAEPFAKQLVDKIAGIFAVSGVVLYDRQSDEFYRAGPSDFEGVEVLLRDAARQGTSAVDEQHGCTITSVRLGSEPVAGLALKGTQMPDSVVQGIANLVAIGLERARARGLAAQVEAAQQTEKLRTTLIDAMAHELKTPLTSIMAATTALLAAGNELPAGKAELVTIADEEARRLKNLIEDSLEMARLDSGNIQIQPEPSNIADIVREVLSAMRSEIDDRPIELSIGQETAAIAADRRLLKLAVKQLVDNALKYSPPQAPLKIDVRGAGESVSIAVTNQGQEIPAKEQGHIFERLYRGSSVRSRIPGSGLGLSIAKDIVQAHGGSLTFSSTTGETTFRMTLPIERQGAQS